MSKKSKKHRHQDRERDRDGDNGGDAERSPQADPGSGRKASPRGEEVQVVDAKNAEEPNLEVLRQEARQAMHRAHSGGADEQD